MFVMTISPTYGTNEVFVSDDIEKLKTLFFKRYASDDKRAELKWSLIANCDGTHRISGCYVDLDINIVRADVC